MPLEIVRNDITKMDVDAIVNSANPNPVIGGGVDRAIHAKAGAELLAARKEIGKIATGKAYITSAFHLPAKYVIQTVGPVWQDGKHGERELLAQCYENSLRLAAENGCSSIAFPLISAGVFGCHGHSDKCDPGIFERSRNGRLPRGVRSRFLQDIRRSFP